MKSKLIFKINLFKFDKIKHNQSRQISILTYLLIYIFSFVVYICQESKCYAQKHILNFSLNGSYFISSYKLGFIKYSAAYNLAIYENCELLYNYRYMFNINIKYSFKNLFYSFINQEVYCSDFNNKTYNFVPAHAYWVIGTGFKYKFMFCEISHMCSHHIFNNKPITSFNTLSYIYGSSYNKLTIGFNFSIIK